MELRRGIIKAFDPATYTATVQVVGSLGNWLGGVPVAKHLAAGLLSPGSRCGVIFFDPTNPQDACLAFVYEGAPGAWISDAMLEGNIAGSKVVAATTTARGTVELAEAGETTTALAVQANDPRLSDARLPTEHGADRHTNRTRRIWLSPSDFEIVSNTPALVSYGHGTGPNYAKAWAFDQATRESIGTSLMMPADWNGGNISFYFWWAADTDTVTTNVCRWTVSYAFMSAGESIDAVRDGAPYVDELVPSATAHTLAKSAAMVCSAGLTAGVPIRLTCLRLSDQAADTMTGDALLIGVELEYTADM